jgi:LmbE family N-acetylglucosaminyl deacetylase
VCATRGEAGEISDPALATPENLGDVREAELKCAAEAVDASEVILLGYRDSGMAGTPENQDPRAYMNAPDDEVVGRLVGTIRRLRPQVVVTFDPNGGYGHPDHMAVHRHTVEAFHAAGDPARYPDQGAAWQPSRLFYSVWPASLFGEFREQIQALGMDTTEIDEWEESGEGWPDDQIHAVLDVADQVDAKWQALNCHRTQFGPDNLFRRLPEEAAKRMFSLEYFALAWPQPAPDQRLSDLFAGLS